MINPSISILEVLKIPMSFCHNSSQCIDTILSHCPDFYIHHYLCFITGDAIRKRRCKAAFSYIPQNEDELELKIGDVIDILGEVEEGWWEGSLSGKTGMFPSNFTKEILAEEEELATPEDTRSTKTSHTGSESDGGDSSSARSDAGSVASSTEIQPKKVRGFGFGDIFKDQPIKLRPRSVDMDNELEKQPTAKKAAPAVAPETMKTEPDNKARAKEFCKVLFPYDAQNEDELSIKEGEIVTIINKECADAGWWLGELNGKQGVFPDNFVKLFIPEIEKERPKKPPPPAAPATKHITDKKTEVKKVPPERPETLPQRAEEKGEEIQKPSLPAVPPKKPLPPKNNSLNRPSSLPPKRPERPERPAVPSIQSVLKFEYCPSVQSEIKLQRIVLGCHNHVYTALEKNVTT
uniref:Osteoclast-stimulating factor 1 n=1 Tax=Astyanax mexicanus TaxID=7994 RepID=A0A8B9RHG1_ASTMX